MIFNNSQQDIDFSQYIPLNYSKIGMKISGGADSAIVCYMLAKHVMTDRPDITIYPVTGIADGKAYQKIFAEQVLLKITELTGVQFGTHYCATVRTDTLPNYTLDQDTLVESLYSDKLIDMHLAGITANPTETEAPSLYNTGHMMPDDRTKTKTLRNLIDGNSFRPLHNIHKRGVSEFYTTLGVLDELFPVTRSCEEFTDDFSSHCDNCWHCRERKWGFGRLI
jgi:hypothetical protein|tara:strand:+ start:464 stop:1132 length:669 start_codon:yes stop_codon:yes gene_type:complete